MAVNIATNSLTETSVNTAGNYSTVRYLVQLQTTGESHNDNNITTTYIINGTTYTNTHKLPQRKTTTIVDNTVTVYHNNDGTGSCSASFSCPTRISAGTITGSASINLTKIARFANITAFNLSATSETNLKVSCSADAACDSVAYQLNGGAWVYPNTWNFNISVNAGGNYNVMIGVRRTDSQLWSYSDLKYATTPSFPYVTSTPNFTIGNNLTIQWYNPYSRQLSVYLKGADGSSKLCYEGTGTSISGFVNNEWQNFLYNSIPNSPNGIYKVRIVVPSLDRDTTANGGAYSVDNTSTDVKPIFTTFEYEDANAVTLALTNDNTKIIPKYSNVRVIISDENTAIPQKNATMKYYNINGSQFDYAKPFETTINGFNATTLKIFAIDSRNVSTLAPEQPLNIINYQDVVKGTNEYSRSNQGVGSQVTFVFRGSFWKNNFGQVDNSLTATYKFKKSNASDWTTGTTTININSDESGSFSYSGVLQGDASDNGFEIESSYYVEITVSDKLSSVTYTYTIIEGSPAIDLYGNCISLGAMYDEGLGGRVQINGQKAEDMITNINNNYTESQKDGYSCNFINKIHAYCSLHQSTSSATATGSAWSNPILPLNNFETNNSNIFEFNNNKVRVKESGTYLIFRTLALSSDPNLAERDLTTFAGSTRFTNFSWQNSGTQMLVTHLNANEEIYFSINTASTSIITTNHDILIIKTI